MAQKSQISAPAADRSSPSADLDKLSTPDLYKELQCSAKGLDSREAQQRLLKYGPNALEEKRKSELAVFLAFFWGPIPWMIEAAAIMALVVKDFGDFAIITALLVFNAVLGFWEEHRGLQRAGGAEGGLGPQGPRPARRTVARSRLRQPWCPATSCGCGWATSCPPMLALIAGDI